MPCYKQQPTLQNVRIRTAQDALQVFYAVARNVLTLLTRRLDADERKAIKPGNVYVWEDRSATTSDSGGLSMERWTDGMSWGPSRIREEFLFYYQREPQVQDRPTSSGKPPKPIPESDKLIKQTYSVYVTLPEDQPQDITRKWHLTAYFNQRTVDNLGRIDDVPDVGRMAVPEGLFRSARA
ncbi:Gti1/Pac2 family-domain-containing protein, partial [Amylostereum chailletii]